MPLRMRFGQHMDNSVFYMFVYSGLFRQLCGSGIVNRVRVPVGDVATVHRAGQPGSKSPSNGSSYSSMHAEFASLLSPKY